MLFSVHSFVAHSFRISRYLSVWCLVNGILERTHASTEITSNSTSNGFQNVCNDCVLEAESISILTFPSATNGNGNQLTSIDATAIVTPVITVYNDGEVETSYITSVMGELDTDDPHVILRSGSFWTELGVELTSPTTYAAYLDVLVTTASLSAPTAAPEECYTIENNVPFDASRMIIPLSGEEDTTDDNVPFALSQYFASLPQFSGINIGRCDAVGFANFSVKEKRSFSQYKKPMYRSFGEKVRRQVGTTGLSNSTLSPSTETVEVTPTTVTPTSLSEQNSVTTSVVPPSGSASLITSFTGGTTSSIQGISSSAPRTVTSTQSASSSGQSATSSTRSTFSSSRSTPTPTAGPTRASSSTLMPDTVVNLLPSTTDATTTTVTGRRPSILSVSRPTSGTVSPLTRPPTTLATAQVLVESTSTTRRRTSSNTPMAIAQSASLSSRSTISNPRSVRSTSSTSRSTRSSNTSRSTRSPSNTARSTRSPSNPSPTSISSGRTRSTARTTAAPSSTSTNAVTPSAIAVAVEEFNETIILGSSQTVVRTGSISVESVAATTALPALVVGTVTFTATVNRGSTQFVVGPGNTLTPDGVVTLGETVVSLADDPTEPVAVINGETATIAEVPVLSTPRPITIADEVFTAFVTVSSTFFSFAPTVVLTAGGVVTVSETRVSLAPDATEAVIGSNTVPLADPIEESPGSGDTVEGGDDGDGDIVGDDPATGDNGTFSGAVPKTDFSANWLVSFTICTGLVITLVL